MNSPEKPVYPEPLLSVIIPAHNAEKTLERAVESVAGAMRVIEGNETIRSKEKGFSEQNSTLSFLYEILIIENGSGDSTEFIAAGLQQKYQGRVRALHSEKGVSNARNKGLDEARGKWILFLDADDYYLGDAGAVLRDDLLFSGTDLIVHSYESGDSLIHLCPPSGERFSGDLTQICVRMIENPVRQISQAMTNMQSAAAASERVFEFLGEEELSEDYILPKAFDPRVRNAVAAATAQAARESGVARI